MTLLPSCWRENRREIQNLSGVLFGKERLLRDFCKQQHIVKKHRFGYILLINQLIHQLKASSMWSLLHNPFAHSSAWMLTSASCFRGRFMLDLQTRRVNRSGISSEAFAVFPLEIHWIQSWNPPMPLEFQTTLPPPPHAFGIPVQETPLFLRIPRCRPWYGMDIFWNHPIEWLMIWLHRLLLHTCLKKNTEHKIHFSLKHTCISTLLVDIII